MTATVLKTHKTFNGLTQFWEHDSKSTATKMKFATFTPSGAIKGAIIWLSGLTCTDENFITKAGAQKFLEEKGLMVICPDTSPRGTNLPGEHDSYDFGSGAGFYVNATTPGYKDHYRMFDYVAVELYGMLLNQFKISQDKISIMGHSMGGHGALIIGLRHPEKFRSISVFSPVSNPLQVGWGKRAFEGYLGSDQSAWAQYDATELVKKGAHHKQTILVDQGVDDEFYIKGNLLPENFEAACKEHNQPIQVHYRTGYDHSYYFISTFIESHIKHHAAALA